MGGTAYSRSKNIVQLPTDALIPYVSNARTHSDEQVAQIAASIKEFGFTNPVLVDGSNGIIAGHGRVLAARKLGMTEVPTIELSYLTDAQRRAYILADNKLAMNAGWDDDLLRAELGALDGDDFDLSLIGFSDMELAVLLADLNEGLTDPDETPEPPAEPVSKTGDLWTCGKHRVLCGDAVDLSDVHAAVSGVDVHICITDPPYGVEFEYNDHKDTRENLKALVDGFVPIVRDLCQTVLITPGNSNQRIYPEPDWTLCWFCSAGVGRGPWGFTCWQPILAYGKDPFLKMGKGSRPDSFASNEGKPANVKHTCPKPVGVWRWFMDRADPTECATFFDPFGGSGTTMICAEMSGRRSVLIEKDPCYVDVIVQRWQNFTGEQATLDGKTFDEVSDAA